MTKLHQPKYSWYKYHLALKKYQNIHNRVEKNIEDGTFWEMSEKVQRALLRRLNILFKRLLKILQGVRLGTAAATVAFMILTGNINGQSFTQQTGTYNPLNGANPGSCAVPTFVDIDGDGDFDLFAGELLGYIKYYKNTGTSANPVFSTSPEVGTLNPLGSYSVVSYATPAFVDIDGDGDFDCKIGQYSGSIDNFVNTDTATSPGFGSTTLNSLFTSGSSFTAPTFVDIDGDGDLDAFVGNNLGTINYYENYGTATESAFTSPSTGTANPLDGFSVANYSKPTFVDIDGDGDFDAFVGTGGGAIEYFKNDGTNRAPSFVYPPATENPFNGVNFTSHTAPTFVDIDNDGTLDAFIGDYFGNIHYFKGDAPIVNTDPVVEVNRGATVDEGGSVVITSSMLKASDADGNTYLSYNVFVPPTHGTILLLTDTNLKMDITNDGTFTQTDINRGHVVYQHDGSETTSDRFQFEVTDNSNATAPAETFNITVNPVNAPPEVASVETTDLEYTFGGDPVIVSSTIELSDADNTTLQGATVSITGNFVAEEDLLLFDAAGTITAEYSTSQGILTLSGTATVAAYQAALRTVKYTSIMAGTTGDVTKTIAFNVTDGDDISNVQSRDVNVTVGLNPPTNVVVTTTEEGYIKLTWTDNSGNEVGFQIWRQLVVASAKSSVTMEYVLVGTVPADVATFIDETTAEGANYTYRVTAYNDEGSSGVDVGDNGGQVTTATALFTPSELSAQAEGVGSIILSWNDNSSAEDGYSIERKSDGDWAEIATVGPDVSSYTDSAVDEGVTYSYRVMAFSATNESGYSNEVEITSLITDVDDELGLLPTDYSLNQNYPNPFNPSTTIRFGLPGESNVLIKIYNILGSEVATLVNNVMSAGYHEVRFDASNLTSGIYIYKIQAGSFVQLKKMILMK